MDWSLRKRHCTAGEILVSVSRVTQYFFALLCWNLLIVSLVLDDDLFSLFSPPPFRHNSPRIKRPKMKKKKKCSNSFFCCCIDRLQQRLSLATTSRVNEGDDAIVIVAVAAVVVLRSCQKHPTTTTRKREKCTVHIHATLFQEE